MSGPRLGALSNNRWSGGIALSQLWDSSWQTLVSVVCDQSSSKTRDEWSTLLYREFRCKEGNGVVSTHVVIWGLLEGTGLDGVGHETEDGTDPQEEGETSEEVLAELDPFRDGGRRGQGVRAVTLEPELGLLVGQTLHWKWKKKKGMLVFAIISSLKLFKQIF